MERESNHPKTIQYLEENGDRIVYHDQDALNAVLYEDWLALEPRWNMQTSLVFNRHEAPNEAYQNYIQREIKSQRLFILLDTINLGIR